jgi:hypothetical protein
MQRESVEGEAHEHAQQERERHREIASHEPLRIAGYHLLRIFGKVPDADNVSDPEIGLARVGRAAVRAQRRSTRPPGLEGNDRTTRRKEFGDSRLDGDSV